MATIGDVSTGGRKNFEGVEIAVEWNSMRGVEVGGVSVVEDMYGRLVLLIGGVYVVEGDVNTDMGRYVVTGGAIVDDGGMYPRSAYRPSIGSAL